MTKKIEILFILLVITSTSVLGNYSLRSDTTLLAEHSESTHKLFFTLGIPLTHFSSKSDMHFTTIVNPGVEALVHHHLNKTTRLSTGLNYQYSRYTYTPSSYNNYRNMNELTIPLLATFYLFYPNNLNPEFTIGLYIGQYISIVTDSDPPRIGFEEEPFVNKRNKAEFLSPRDLIGDFYVSYGHKAVFKKVPIGFDLFFRYRLKKHSPINNTISRALYGIKLNYQLKL